MDISKSLLATLLFVTWATLAVKSFRTECDEISNGVCYQYCVGGGCDLRCLKSESYTSCEQVCTVKICIVFNNNIATSNFFQQKMKCCSHQLVYFSKNALVRSCIFPG